MISTGANKPNRYKWAPIKTRKIVYNPPATGGVSQQAAERYQARLERLNKAESQQKRS
jgi:hypothetical protein